MDIVLETAEKKLHCLLKLAHCQYYKFKPSTIYKLFESVIRPKLEYSFCTISKSRIEMLERAQKRAMRIAVQVKKQTPTSKLLNVVNGKTMMEKLKELQLKLWHKYKRAPDYLLQHWTFKQWMEYIQVNDLNSYDNNNVWNINPAIFDCISKSPLSKAYNTVKSLYNNNKNIIDNKQKSVMEPPPVYTVPYPTNISINRDNNMDLNKLAREISNHWNYDEMKPNSKRLNHHCWNFFTDGWCLPNPRPGRCAYYSTNLNIESKIYIIDHDTSINYCELYGVKLVLQSIYYYIKFCNENNYNFEMSYTNISQT